MADKKTVTIDSDLAAKLDTNGDGHISAEEMAMNLEFKRKRLEDADAMRDAQRNMAWFALFGMLLYPFSVVIAELIGLDKASGVLLLPFMARVRLRAKTEINLGGLNGRT